MTNIQPIDLPSLLRAISWPVIVMIAVAVLREPLANMVAVLGQRVNKLSVGAFSMELTTVQEMQPRAMDAEIRQLEAGLIPQSGSTSLTALVNELQSGGRHDYVVIDLGSESEPRWLTSRLYLLAFLVTLINRQLCLVFVETVGGFRKRFIGTASPEKLRWALAQSYGWLESAAVSAYAMQAGIPPAGPLYNPVPANQFDPSTGYLLTMIPTLIKQYLLFIRQSTPPPDPAKSEWVFLEAHQTSVPQTYEHARWLNGARIEALLGNDLSTARVTRLPNKTLSDLADPVLAERGRFIAVVEQDKTFFGVVDRQEVVEAVAREFLRQAKPTQS